MTKWSVEGLTRRGVVVTTEMKPNDEVPSERQLRMALDDFRAWVDKHERPPDAAPRVRLMEVVGMARATFYGICDSGQMWTARRRFALLGVAEAASCPLGPWMARAIVRLSNEFRAVSVALEQPLSAVSQSWWDNGDYSDFGLVVRGSGRCR